MTLPSQDILRRLGAGEPIDRICAAAKISRQQFDIWWQSETRSRLPETSGTRTVGVQQPVQIARDGRGVPHISADSDSDLFFGFGYALAQDRLFQLDYLRRRGSGRMSEVFGAKSADLDLLRSEEHTSE